MTFSAGAISLVQTTGGALAQVADNLSRIRLLTVQAGTGIPAPSERVALQQAVQERLDAIDTIAQQTQFNGIKVLATNQDVVVETLLTTVNVELKETDTTALGLSGFDPLRNTDPYPEPGTIELGPSGFDASLQQIGQAQASVNAERAALAVTDPKIPHPYEAQGLKTVSTPDSAWVSGHPFACQAGCVGSVGGIIASRPTHYLPVPAIRVAVGPRPQADHYP